MANVIFKFGTRAQYDAILTKDSNTLYWLLDEQALYRGDVLFGIGKTASISADGLLSAEDKAKLDELVSSAVRGLSAADGSISVSDGTKGKEISVQLSQTSGNILQLLNDGLFVPVPGVVVVPEFSMERQSVAEDNASATYKLKRTWNGESTYVGDAINIPADLVLRSGSLEVVTEAEKPYAGATVGDMYLDLVLSDTTASHIYVPVNGLIDVYTAGDGINVENNVISLNVDSGNGLSVGPGGLAMGLATTTTAGALSATDKEYLDTLPSVLSGKTDRLIAATNGRSLIFNEGDGGGTKFEHSDGTLSFLGVNDGGAEGITGQLYSVKQEGGKYVGTRMNMTSDGFYYLPKSNSSQYTAKDEIATKGDIENAALVWGEL